MLIGGLKFRHPRAQPSLHPTHLLVQSGECLLGGRNYRVRVYRFARHEMECFGIKLVEIARVIRKESEATEALHQLRALFR